ncbi:MAG: PIN domain-containing protein [Anaerolineae bacterium]|nr:PIN domain-containing protein [Anaerolineae bacterium]
MRVFVDASVLFSAIFSAHGHARDLLTLAGRDALTLVVSRDVLDETERNLRKKSPGKVPLLTTLIGVLEPEIIEDLTPEEVAAAAEYTVQKDAPIVAAAIKARPDYLVTYDHKDLLDPPEVAEKSGLAIVRPETVIRQLRH